MSVLVQDMGHFCVAIDIHKIDIVSELGPVAVWYALDVLGVAPSREADRCSLS